MNANRYTILGYAVWHGGKWYLRRRLPSRRTVLLAGAGALGLSAAVLTMVRRRSA
ncbi:MAG TPA: hypothetical protein VK765_01130 [Solirubrobacteraceae bacterium]|jgi:hypothetical protein|nr:hypothetical protein [Solirubrobacteraceae bacterium]